MKILYGTTNLGKLLAMKKSMDDGVRAFFGEIFEKGE